MILQLDKDTIYTVATAALQEVDRQQQADKVRIAELEAKVAEQQSLINDILERLKKEDGRDIWWGWWGGGRYVYETRIMKARPYTLGFNKVSNE
jgi:hypothetical protein